MDYRYYERPILQPCFRQFFDIAPLIVTKIVIEVVQITSDEA